MFFAFASATAATALSMFALLPLLRRIAMIDHPTDRSLHAAPTPRGGGLAVVIGIATGFAVGVLDHSIHVDTLAVLCIAAALAMGAIGLMDDLVSLSARIRLVAQLAVGSAIATAAVVVSTSTTWVLVISPVVGALGGAAFVNAYNFMDGVNGISSFTAIVAGGWYAFLGSNLNDPALILGGVLAGAAFGFLPWNAPRARVFLGDVGSYSMGALLAFLALDVAIRHDAPLAAIAPLIVYITDTGTTLVRRARRGEQLTEPHREHVYQRLVTQGRSHITVAVAAAGAAGLICVAVRYTVAPFAEIISIAILLSYVMAPHLIDRMRATS